MADKKNNKLILQNNNIITEEQAELLIKQANYLNILDYMKEEQLIKQIDMKQKKKTFLSNAQRQKVIIQKDNIKMDLIN